MEEGKNRISLCCFGILHRRQHCCMFMCERGLHTQILCYSSMRLQSTSILVRTNIASLLTHPAPHIYSPLLSASTQIMLIIIIIIIIMIMPFFRTFLLVAQWQMSFDYSRAPPHSRIEDKYTQTWYVICMIMNDISASFSMSPTNLPVYPIPHC